MTDYDNTNSGVLFRNDRKESDRHPDYRGTIHVKCPVSGVVTEYWLSGWIKTAGMSARNPGSKFFSLAVTAKDDIPDDEPTKPTKRKSLNDDGELQEDDIPF